MEKPSGRNQLKFRAKHTDSFPNFLRSHSLRYYSQLLLPSNDASAQKYEDMIYLADFQLKGLKEASDTRPTFAHVISSGPRKLSLKGMGSDADQWLTLSEQSWLKEGLSARANGLQTVP